MNFTISVKTNINFFLIKKLWFLLILLKIILLLILKYIFVFFIV